MADASDTIRVLIPLKLRKKNGRPQILPPAGYKPSEDRSQDPHILRAIGRAWAWRRRLEAGEFSTVEELAKALNLGDRHVNRLLRLDAVLDMTSKERVLRLPENADVEDTLRRVDSWQGSLKVYGMQISTGPVVPFRATEFLDKDGRVPDSHVPLLWMNHVQSMQVTWPTRRPIAKLAARAPAAFAGP